MRISRSLTAAGTLAVLVAALLPATVTAAPAASPDVPASQSHTDRVIVQWSHAILSHGIRPQSLSVPDVAGRAATFVRETGSGAFVYAFDAPLGRDADRVLASLRHVPGVASVEPDLWMTADALPNDPYASNLWGLLGPGDSPSSPYGIDALSAWNAGVTGAGVTVAVIDTGLVSHSDLAGQSIAGYDMISDPQVSNDGNGRDADPSDPGDWCNSVKSSWHGTHVSGTIAALANNSLGVFGGAPNVKIEPVRVLGTCGGYLSDISDGIRWAAGGTVPGVPANAHPARVLNLSLGGSYSTCPAEYQSAITDARSRGAVVVVSAGNDARDASKQGPANCANAITVAATDQNGYRASFSNFGSFVDVAAPGVQILSTVNGGTTTPNSTSAYANYQGTSMAAPHVTLTAALIASLHPEFTPDQIETVLLGTTTGLPADPAAMSCQALGCGIGIVSAGRAIARLGSTAPIVGPVTSSVMYATPGSSVTLTANVVDLDGVASALVNVDGTGWLSMNAADGAFGGHFETVTRTVAAPMAEGWHTVCVSASDTLGGSGDSMPCGRFAVDATPPAVSTPTVTPAPAVTGRPLTITSTATDSVAVARAEVRIDSGAWQAMVPADGRWGGTTEQVTGVAGLSATSFSTNLHTCSLLTDGSLWCWGQNADGELGNGTKNLAPIPIRNSLMYVTAVATGTYDTCALLSDTSARCWGWNGYGQLGDGTNTTRTSPATVSGLYDAVALSAGPEHTCALLSDTTVRCWGHNNRGQLGDGSTTDRWAPVQVMSSAATPLSGVTAIAVGVAHTCALLSDTTVRCWGANDNGEIGDTTNSERHYATAVYGLSAVTAIGAGDHTCALLAAGTVRCWGLSDLGQVGDGYTTSRNYPVAVSGLTGVTSIAVGWDQTCAIVSGGGVKCWGSNYYGQVGDNTTALTRPSPVVVVGLPGPVLAVSAGAGTSCGKLASGLLVCWGYNPGGELGVGIAGDQRAPAAVVGFGELAPGSHQFCVRATDAAGYRSSGTACVTLGFNGPPSAPGNVTATRGDGQATVSWTASTPHGYPISEYVVTSSPDGKECRTIGLTCTVTTLTNGTAYTFSVVATSSVGNSPAGVSNSVTPAGLPGAPGNVTTTRGDQTVVVHWTAAPANGSAIQSYTVTSSPGSQQCTTSNLFCTFNALTNGTPYTFTISATNGIGPGPSVTSAPVVPAVLVERYSGPDRFSTAADVSSHTFPANCACTVYIANAYNFPDALAGAAAAGTVKGPVLLVESSGAINPATITELVRLQPTKIVVLGGTAVVGPDVYSALSSYADSIGRYSGADRFGTAADVSSHTFPANCACTVYIANAYNFPDALAGAAAAGTVKGPVLLVAASGAVNQATLSELVRLTPSKIVVLGGTAAVGADVYTALSAYAPSITRFAGSSRFGTAAETSAGTFASGCGCTVYIANAYNFPDALAGAAAAGTVAGPVLLVSASGAIDAATVAELQRLKPVRIVVLGGVAAVDSSVFAALAAFVQ